MQIQRFGRRNQTVFLAREQLEPELVLGTLQHFGHRRLAHVQQPRRARDSARQQDCITNFEMRQLHGAYSIFISMRD